jgi:hypothetical protein
MSDERTKAEIEATLEAVRPIVLDLRRRGYDATPWVQQRVGHVTVEVHIRIPPAGQPIETTEEVLA